MCGIAGFLDPEGTDAGPILAQMLASIVHRGPDDLGAHHTADTHVGMTRLAVIDIAGGAQPMHLEDGTAHLVMNGEIYNHRELRRVLERLGHRFTTASDTEVLLRGYAAWGHGVFERLDGMFATAIIDSRRGALVLARDRFGEKPLYVWDRPGGPAFASEPKALRPLGSFPAVDQQALMEYLHLGYVPAPRSIWQGISKLRPAEVAVYARGRWSRSRFWRPRADDPEPGVDPVDRLQELLLGSVESRLVADVEVGLLLSGGIDSSLVAWAAAQCQPRIRTFTVTFDDPTRDESRTARLTSQALGTTHQELRVHAQDALALVNVLPTVYDEPFADSSAVPSLLLCRAVSEHVKVALTGDGGDELFSGYPRYATFVRAQRRGLPAVGWLASKVGGLSTSGSPVLSRIGNVAAKHGPTPAATYRASNAILSVPLLQHLTGASPDFTELEDRIAGSLAAFGDAGPRAADLDSYLPDDLLVKMDRASMAASLETRVPFLTPRISGWALGLPAEAIGPPGAKALPRALARRVLPGDLASLPKRGFSVPLAQWLRGPLASALDEALAPSELRAQGTFDPKAVDLLLRRLRAGRQGVAAPLWALLIYQRWLSGQ